jgi:hypothetical protein
MRVISSLVLFGFLAACGADGAPTAPNPKTGVAISGDARVGVVTTN